MRNGDPARGVLNGESPDAGKRRRRGVTGGPPKNTPPAARLRQPSPRRAQRIVLVLAWGGAEGQRRAAGVHGRRVEVRLEVREARVRAHVQPAVRERRADRRDLVCRARTARRCRGQRIAGRHGRRRALAAVSLRGVRLLDIKRGRRRHWGERRILFKHNQSAL